MKEETRGLGDMNEIPFKSRLERRADSVRQLLLRRFKGLVDLSMREEQALSKWAMCLDEHEIGSELHREDSPRQKPFLITQGWACCQHVFRDGRRQVICILVPGDVVGFKMPSQPSAVTTTIALTRVETCDLDLLRQAIATADATFQNLIRACAMLEALEQSYLLHQIVRLGRQTAYERLAHLLLELYSRLKTSGLVKDDSFFLPLTQELLADTLGLSSVHVNRTLQQLRRDNLIHWKGGVLKLLEPEELSVVADFKISSTSALPVAGRSVAE